MFKKEKELTGARKTLLKNKDVRMLREQICRQYSVTNDELSDALGAKPRVELARLANRTNVYIVPDKDSPKGGGGATALFFQPEGRGPLFPTVYALWYWPAMMPVLTVHAPVSRFLLRGADLMLPGVLMDGPEGAV